MTKRVRVGVITQSRGAHLKGYFAALAETPEVQKVAVADDSGESVAMARELLGDRFAGAYKSTSRLLRAQKPQLALVSMEPTRAPAEIGAALDAGCHVLTEKPACLRSEDFRALVRKAQNKHLEVMLTLANRPHAPVAEARRIVSQGLLGRLYGISMHLVADQARLKRADYRGSWRGFKARAGGGHLIWLGIYWLDMAMHVTGLKVHRVAAFTRVVGGQPIDVEDSASVSLEFNDGVLGTMLSGFYLDQTFKENLGRYHSHMQIWGEDGWLHLSTFEDLPLQWYSNRSPGRPQIRQFDYPRGQRSYQPFVQAAVRSSVGMADPPITSEECLHVLEVIFAAYTAAESGQTQTIT